jgi:hypothetical protein
MIYHRDATLVYELLPGRAEQDAVACDFLSHFDEAGVETLPGGNGGAPRREYRRIGEDGRLSMVASPNMRVQFRVKIPDHAELSFAIAKGNRDCTDKAVFQVWISSAETGRRMAYSRDLEGAAPAGWVEEHVDLDEYAGLQAAVSFTSGESLPCSDLLWADPVLIARSGMAPGHETRDAPRSPEPNLVVSGASVTPARVRVGQSFEASFLGPDLSFDTCFDVLVRLPGSSADQVVNNWQKGTPFRHNVDASTATGAWVITGVRAHKDPFRHSGDFLPLKIRLEVSR